SLQRARTYNILVVRQEATTVNELSTNMGGSINLGSVKRGTGKLVALPAYKNDVLHALAETGGLPGLDAENTVYVLRRRSPQASTAPRNGTEMPRGLNPDGDRGVPVPPAGNERAQTRRQSDIILASAEFEAPDNPFGYTAAKPPTSKPQATKPAVRQTSA